MEQPKALQTTNAQVYAMLVISVLLVLRMLVKKIVVWVITALKELRIEYHARLVILQRALMRVCV